MMFLLRLDVASDFFNVLLTQGESAIATLPGEILEIWKNIMHPAARVCLEFAQYIRKRLVWPKLCQKVNVIFGAVKL